MFHRLPRTSSLLLPALAVALAWLAVHLSLPGLTRLELTDADTGRTLLAANLRDGETMTLIWHNSLFDQPVREVFYARDGVLVLDEVTFLDPGGAYEMPVTPADVADLYHTGGAFSAHGVDRPFDQVIFRIGEIGDLHVQVRERIIALKQAVGFGGRVRLATRRAVPVQIISSLLSPF